MTTPTNHTVTILNRYGNTITARVVYVKDLGGGRAEVRVETNYNIAETYDYPATYATPSHEAKGHYRVTARIITMDVYIYVGIFTREDAQQL